MLKKTPKTGFNLSADFFFLSAWNQLLYEPCKKLLAWVNTIFIFKRSIIFWEFMLITDFLSLLQGIFDVYKNDTNALSVIISNSDSSWF